MTVTVLAPRGWLALWSCYGGRLVVQGLKLLLLSGGLGPGVDRRKPFFFETPRFGGSCRVGLRLCR